MGKLIHIKKLQKISRKQRGQVFILATLIIVVYTVSMIAVVTELSIDRTKTDEIDLPHMVNEYLSEMNYQLQLQLFNYITNSTFIQSDIINSLQTFITTFSHFASTKGIGTTINLRLNEFSFYANKNSTANTVLPGVDFNTTTYLAINSSILFQSSNSGSKISGTFNHYYGINMFIPNTNPTTLMLTQRDAKNHILQYISGAIFSDPTPVIDNNNGNYTYTIGFQSQFVNATIPSGLQIVA